MTAKKLIYFLMLLSGVTAQAQFKFAQKSLHQVYEHPDGFYSYAPSVIDMGDTQYLWTCHNHDAFIVRDNIVMSTLFQGRLIDDRSVLAPSFTGWDSFHICDPSVMRSDITYNKITYHWVMFFLGNDVNRSAHNQIGVALSQSVVGPWEKFPSPIVRNSGAEDWGVGQPSAVPLDGKGKFLLVYSGGGLHMVTVDLDNLDNIIVSKPIAVTTNGLGGMSESRWPLSNMDIAFSADRKYIFAVADIRVPQTTAPKFITSQLAVVSIATKALLTGKGKWTVDGIIGPKITGFPRNHNAGLVRGPDGRLGSGGKLSVVFTRSCAVGSNMPCRGRPEWSYDLWEISASLKK